MQLDRNSADHDAALRLQLVLATVVQQAQHVPPDSAERRALASAARPLRDALGDLPEVRLADLDRVGRVLDAALEATPAFRDALEDSLGARRITIERASQLADAAVAAGLASWAGHDRLFRTGDALRGRLAEMGGNLNGLHDDEADELATFIAAAP